MTRTAFSGDRMTSHPQNMQARKPFLWTCLALALFASACGQQPPPDTRAAVTAENGSINIVTGSVSTNGMAFNYAGSPAHWIAIGK